MTTTNALTATAARPVARGDIDRSGLTIQVPESYRVYAARDGGPEKTTVVCRVRVPFVGMDLALSAAVYGKMSSDGTMSLASVSLPAAMKGVIAGEGLKNRVANIVKLHLAENKAEWSKMLHNAGKAILDNGKAVKAAAEAEQDVALPVARFDLGELTQVLPELLAKGLQSGDIDLGTVNPVETDELGDGSETD